MPFGQLVMARNVPAASCTTLTVMVHVYARHAIRLLLPKTKRCAFTQAKSRIYSPPMRAILIENSPHSIRSTGSRQYEVSLPRVPLQDQTLSVPRGHSSSSLSLNTNSRSSLIRAVVIYNIFADYPYRIEAAVRVGEPFSTQGLLTCAYRGAPDPATESDSAMDEDGPEDTDNSGTSEAANLDTVEGLNGPDSPTGTQTNGWHDEDEDDHVGEGDDYSRPNCTTM
ncbi:hypothetical protein LTS08_008306 [Lithohypha guttulata]|nr:hypothetical protein LTS08_008306 [Lithohypha guttulata]